ncbi:MAG: deoxyribodipyrimidine photo-lyase [Candidatus Riflebacteria bacterium]|nr:deoxyribodipyrimidine photo-lyase [Candidatus Riflebacteria bacterium]
MKALVWFRRDLRINDNKALHFAAEKAGELQAVYVVSREQWRMHNEAPAKIAFWKACLQSLELRLAELGISLHLLVADHYHDIPEAIASFAIQHKCSAVFFNREYEVNEIKRDELVTGKLKKAGINSLSFDDRVLLAPGSLLTGSGGFYTVFTPFKRSWLGLAARHDLKPLAAPAKRAAAISIGTSATEKWQCEASWRSDLWPAGEQAALDRLHKFARQVMGHYHLQRDLPNVNGTSLLSPYLAAGVLSPRQCLQEALAAGNVFPPAGTGQEVWLSELIWRDFYAHVLVGFPRVGRSQPFKLQTKALKWVDDQEQFEKWQAGETGFPVVDAAMRQLRQTGWMHNRLRMVTAMFLSKYLFIDWREGEKYFIQTLLDGDLAANNGGWQWSASTGTDAVPYFRIFNPFSQSLRFDPDGSFIRKFCPEISSLPTAALHDPKKLAAEVLARKLQYPPMMIDPRFARSRVMAAFKALGT